MSNRTSNKRTIELVEDVYVTSCRRPRTVNNTFELLIKNNTFNHERYKVDLVGEKKCDAIKLHPTDLISGSGNYTTMQKLLSKNPNIRPEEVSRDYWSPNQYTKIEKITFQTLSSKLKEIMLDNSLCRIEYYEEPNAHTITSLIREGSKLIELSGECECSKQQMYKQLSERTQIGTYTKREGFFRRGDQKLDNILNGNLMFFDAQYGMIDRVYIIPIKVRKIKSLTYKLTRYEII